MKDQIPLPLTMVCAREVRKRVPPRGVMKSRNFWRELASHLRTCIADFVNAVKYISFYISVYFEIISYFF